MQSGTYFVMVDLHSHQIQILRASLTQDYIEAWLHRCSISVNVEYIVWLPLRKGQKNIDLCIYRNKRLESDGNGLRRRKKRMRSANCKAKLP